MVTDGVSGYLTKPGDLNAYAEALSKLLFNPDHCRAMGIAARKDAEARFDRLKITAQYEDMYHRVLQAD